MARRKNMPRRRGASPALARAKSAATAVRRRVTNAKREQKEMLATLAGPAALGWATARGVNLPTVAGIRPDALYGAVFGLGLPMFIKGNTGRMLSAAGVGMLACAARDLASGQPLRVSGDWEVSGDYIGQGGEQYYSPEDWRTAGVDVVDV